MSNDSGKAQNPEGDASRARSKEWGSTGCSCGTDADNNRIPDSRCTADVHTGN